MVDPYRMVFTSIFFSIIVLFLLIIYFKFFAKKKINYIFILLLISLLPIISIFRAGSYESGDLSLHTMRTVSFYQILFVEHILPGWTPEFNVGYGDPHFLFAYFLPYLIGSSLHFIGFTFLDSIKILLASSFILSGLTMYAWIKDELGEKAGFVSALFYLFAPYHLVDLHFRVTIAETLSFVFLPLLLLLTKKIINRPTLYTVIAGSVCYGLLILTHQIISLTFSPILITYGLFIWLTKKKRRSRELVVYFLTILLGFLLTTFYWVPIITEAPYTQASLSRTISSFTPLHELLYSPWRFGFLFQGHRGELSFIIGYTQLFIIFASIYLLCKHQFDKKTKRLLLFFFILFFILVFMILPESQELWKIIPFFKYTQYSYRLSEFIVLCTATIAGIVVTRWNKNIFIILLCFITVFYTILNWGNRKAISHITDTYLINQFIKKPDVGMYLEPSSPIWADLKKSKLRIKPKSRIEILSGKAQIKELSRTSITHKYLIHAATQVKIKENTLFFPGWTLLVDEKPRKIIYTDKNHPGITTFILDKGLHEVVLTFRDTKNRSVSLMVSIFTIIFLIILLFFSLIKKSILYKNR